MDTVNAVQAEAREKHLQARAYQSQLLQARAMDEADEAETLHNGELEEQEQHKQEVINSKFARNLEELKAESPTYRHDEQPWAVPRSPHAYSAMSAANLSLAHSRSLSALSASSSTSTRRNFNLTGPSLELELTITANSGLESAGMASMRSSMLSSRGTPSYGSPTSTPPPPPVTSLLTSHAASCTSSASTLAGMATSLRSQPGGMHRGGMEPYAQFAQQSVAYQVPGCTGWCRVVGVGGASVPGGTSVAALVGALVLTLVPRWWRVGGHVGGRVGGVLVGA
jgi:hypothetical protein